MLNLEAVTDSNAKTISVVNKDTNFIYLTATYCPESNEVVIYHRDFLVSEITEDFLQLAYMYIYCVEETRDRWCSKNDTTIEERVSHNGNIVRIHKKNGIDKKIEIRSQYSGRPIKTIYRYKDKSTIHLFDGKKNSPEKIISINKAGEKKIYKMNKGGIEYA